MDPITLKLVQMILATLIGAGTIYLGYRLFIKGIEGKIDFEIGSEKINAKMANASPGAIVILIGAIIIFWALNSGGTFKESKKEVTAESIKDEWLSNVPNVKPEDGYSEIIFKLFGDAAVKNKLHQLNQNQSLESLSVELYGETKYWPLLAVLNRDRGYFEYEGVSRLTEIPKTSYMEYFIPSKFNTPITSYEQFVEVRGNDLKRAYDYLLEYAQREKFIDDTFEELDRYFKDNFEFGLSIKAHFTDSQTTFEELSLIYYRDKKYSELIKWLNPDFSALAEIPNDTDLSILIFLP